MLVVDDQADARDLIKRVLEDCAAEVITAGTRDGGARCFEARSSRDVLVSDIGMPDIDGFELLRRVRALGPERGGRIPRHRADRVCALRGSDARAARRLSVHVSKPVDPTELVATVASVARRAT